jgi:hypothetical protein
VRITLDCIHRVEDEVSFTPEARRQLANDIIESWHTFSTSMPASEYVGKLGALFDLGRPIDVGDLPPWPTAADYPQ